MVHPAPMGISFVGASKLTTYVFIYLLVALTLSLLLLHLRHSRLIAAEIKAGMANARDILDSSDEGIVITNGSGKVIRFNQMAVQIFGFEAKNIIGKDFLMLLPDELHQVHQRTMSGSAPDATSQNLEIVARRADGMANAGDHKIRFETPRDLYQFYCSCDKLPRHSCGIRAFRADTGVFDTKSRDAREAQNPKTLEKVHVPAKRSVKFKMGRLMKQKLNTHE